MSEAILIAIVAAVGVSSGGFFGYLTGRSRTKFKLEQLEEDVNALKHKECPCAAVKTIQVNESKLNKAVEELRLEMRERFTRMETLLEVQRNRPHNERAGDI